MRGLFRIMFRMICCSIMSDDVLPMACFVPAPTDRFRLKRNYRDRSNSLFYRIIPRKNATDF